MTDTLWGVVIGGIIGLGASLLNGCFQIWLKDSEQKKQDERRRKEKIEELVFELNSWSNNRINGFGAEFKEEDIHIDCTKIQTLIRIYTPEYIEDFNKCFTALMNAAGANWDEDEEEANRYRDNFIKFTDILTAKVAKKCAHN